MAKRQDRGEYGPLNLQDTWDSASQREREQLIERINSYLSNKRLDEAVRGGPESPATPQEQAQRTQLSSTERAARNTPALPSRPTPESGPIDLGSLTPNYAAYDTALSQFMAKQRALNQESEGARIRRTGQELTQGYRAGKGQGPVQGPENASPMSRPASQPANQPASRPASQPAPAPVGASPEADQPGGPEQLPGAMGEFLQLRNGRPPGTATSEGSSFTEPDAMTQRVGRMDQSGAEREMRGLVRDTKGTNDILREYYDKYGQVPDSIEYDIYGNPVPRYSASSVARIKNRLTLRRMAAEAQNAEEQAAGVDPQSRRLDLATQAEARRAASDAQRNELAVQDMELKQRQTAAKEKAAADEKANQAGVGLGVLMTSTNPDVAAFRDMYTRAQESGDLSGAPASVYDQALQGGATFLASIAGRDSKDPFARPLNQNVVEATTNALAPLMERIRQEREKAQATKNSFADQTAQANVMIDQELQNVLAQTMPAPPQQQKQPGLLNQLFGWNPLGTGQGPAETPSSFGGTNTNVGNYSSTGIFGGHGNSVAALLENFKTGAAPLDNPLVSGRGLMTLTAVPTSAITAQLLSNLMTTDTLTSRAISAMLIGAGGPGTQEQLKNILVRKYGIAMNDLMFRMGASDDRWRAILEDTMRSVKGNKRAEPSKFVPAPRQ